MGILPSETIMNAVWIDSEAKSLVVETEDFVFADHTIDI